MAKRTQTLPPTQTSGISTKARPPRQFPAFVAMTRAAFLAQLRSFANLFFGFLFPLVFMAVFGLLSSSGSNSISLGIVNGSDASSPIYQALKATSADSKSGLSLTFGSQSDLDAKLKSGNLDGVILITPVQRTITSPASVPSPAASPSATAGATTSATPSPGAAGTSGSGTPSAPTTRTVQGDDITLVTSIASPQSGAIATAYVQGVIDQVNLRVAGVTNPAVQLTSVTQVEGQKSNYNQFALPGLIGFSLLGIGIFGTAFGFVVLKRTLVLKRIFATPTRATTIVLAQGAARLLIAFLQVVALILAGIYLPFVSFQLANGAVTFVEMTVVSMFGLVVFLGFGLVIAGNFRDENAMGPVVNLVTLPQFLLGGVFFPTNGFPDWLQVISNNMPLSYLTVALRDIATQGATLWDVRGQLLGMAVWGVVTYAVAIRTFKWE